MENKNLFREKFFIRRMMRLSVIHAIIYFLFLWAQTSLVNFAPGHEVDGPIAIAITLMMVLTMMAGIVYALRLFFGNRKKELLNFTLFFFYVNVSIVYALMILISLKFSEAKFSTTQTLIHALFCAGLFLLVYRLRPLIRRLIAARGLLIIMAIMFIGIILADYILLGAGI